MKIVIWNVQLIKLNEADISIKTFLNESLIQNMGELFFTQQRIRFIRFADSQLDKHKNTKRVLNVLNLKNYLPILIKLNRQFTVMSQSVLVLLLLFLFSIYNFDFENKFHEKFSLIWKQWNPWECRDGHLNQMGWIWGILKKINSNPRERKHCDFSLIFGFLRGKFWWFFNLVKIFF